MAFEDGFWRGGRTSDGKGGTAMWVDAACPDMDTDCSLPPLFCFYTAVRPLGVYRAGRAAELAEIHRRTATVAW